MKYISKRYFSEVRLLRSRRAIST